MDSCSSCSSNDVVSVCARSDIDFSLDEVQPTEKELYDEDDMEVGPKGANGVLSSETEKTDATTAVVPTISEREQTTHDSLISPDTGEFSHVGFAPRRRLHLRKRMAQSARSIDYMS